MSAAHASVARPQAGIAPRSIQRDCACGGSCEKCRRKKLQRKADPGAGSTTAPALGGLDTGGHALHPALRGRLEPLFGTSFADVRVHDDASSHAAARALHANAFTWGQHIHFGAGRYRPDSERGLHLLAHELAHTVQQRGSAPVAAADAIEVGAPDSPLEREADASADAIVAGRAAGPGPLPGIAALLQRDAIPGEATMDIPDGSGGGVRIHRTMRDRPCDAPEYAARGETTPRDRIFEWDEEAHAIRLHYSMCYGSVRLTTDSSIDYSRVVEAGRRLLDTLQNNPAAGADPATLASTAIDQAQLGATGAVTLTVDGVLQLRVGAEAEAGAGDQGVRINGELRIAPNGDVTFVVRGGADFGHDRERDLSRYSLGLRVGTRWFQIDLNYLRDERTPAGGGTTARESATGEIRIPIPGTTIAPFIRGQLELDRGGVSGGSILGGIDVPLETPRPGRVNCYTCRCPPPLPEYACTPYGTREVTDRAADTRRPALLYQYDNEQPADRAEFDARVASIASLAGQGYEVRAISGYASPEGTVAYNQALAQRRADHARGGISARLPAGASALPVASGVGELLGESSSAPGQEARNRELTTELRNRLVALGPDERLDLLGVDSARRSDPVQRQQALDDIESFVQGRDARGRGLSGRARWERVFPFLRRVEVELHRPAVTHTERVDRPGARGGCSPDQQAQIDREHPIPDEARLPTRSCDG
ncbi:eCIS core domain-containing protein [Pseudoxanthomonas sp. 10H]|uniref:eCIS core domain-containing protein n=1 Tax=Pseudoxanthomonas sp. 10H TaxID=3242729 RepID=UPI003556E434